LSKSSASIDGVSGGREIDPEPALGYQKPAMGVGDPGNFEGDEK
jgi:hypothetical protein